LSLLGSVAAWVLLPLGSNPALLAEISDDSNSLRDLHKGFVTSISDKIQVCNFFEQRKTRILSVGIFNWEEFVSITKMSPGREFHHLMSTQCVPESSATFDKADSVPLPVDHYGLNKFQKESNNYTMVIGRLAKLITSLLFSKQKQFLSVPPSKIDTYTERPTLSSAVVEKLRILHDNADVPRALAIHGLGGCGKTQLALKYIEDHRAEYRTILWIDAKDETSTRSSFERCAYDLQLGADFNQTDNSKLDDHPAVRAVFQWLGRQDEIEENWLMIFDNADDVTWGLRQVIPRGSYGSVLITSQDTKSRQLVRGGCEELHVDTLEPEEALALLLRHLQVDTFEITKDILHDCEAVAQRLGYLALAVGLAGAYIANSDGDTPDALRQYLQDFSRHQKDLLKHQHCEGLSDYDKTVWTVWETSLTRIETKFPDLRPGLLLAFLARFEGAVVQDEVLRLASTEMKRIHEALYPESDAVPKWLSKALTLTDTTKERAWDDFHYRKSRDILVRYNLLQRVQGSWSGVSMHGLVRWRASRYANMQQSEKWQLVTVVSACSAVIRDHTRPRFRRELLSHMSPVPSKRLDRLGIVISGKSFIWTTFGHIFFLEGLWKAAEKVRLRSLHIHLEVLGEEDPATLNVSSDLATTYNRQALWAEAEEIQVWTLHVRLRVLGPEHPDTFHNMSSLASTYRNQGRLVEAEALQLQEAETRAKIFGEEHPDTLHCMSRLASTYYKQRLFDKAEPLQAKYLELCRKLYGENHELTVSSKLELSWTYNRQKRWLEAEEIQVQVLEARKELYGADHHLTLDAMAALSETYWFQNKFSDAEKLDVQVLKGVMPLFGVDHPKSLDTIKSLASTYQSQGRLKEADDLRAGRINLNSL
jgi:tetratricopeptide (TPR) repeat protein